MGAPAGARTAPASGAPLRRADAAVNGTTIAYGTTGSGPPVVLLHAGVGDGRLWEAQARALAPHRLVVVPDLRGFGSSPLPGGPFSHAEDVRALLDALRIERAAVVGNSFGGRVALDLAVAHPARVEALVLVAPALGGHEPSPELRAFDETEDELLERGDVEGAVELNVRAWLDGPGREAAPVAPEVRMRLAEMQRTAFAVQLAAEAAEPAPGPVSWAEPPAEERLHEIAVPTLVVAGVHDFADFRELAARLAAGIPGARSALLHTGHLPGLERPEELGRLLADFLS